MFILSDIFAIIKQWFDGCSRAAAAQELLLTRLTGSTVSCVQIIIFHSLSCATGATQKYVNRNKLNCEFESPIIQKGGDGEQEAL